MNDNFTQEGHLSLNRMEAETYEHVTVLLEKDHTSQGFGVAVSVEGDDTCLLDETSNIVVSDIVRGSPADSLLQIGDIILAINGMSMERVSHEKAVETLRSMKNTVYLLVKRQVHKPACQHQYSQNKEPTPSVTIAPASNEKRPQFSKKTHPVIENSSQNPQVFVQKEVKDVITKNFETITLNLKKGRDGYGICLGNVIFVKDKIVDGPAYDSDLQFGDIIQKINDYPIEDFGSGDEVLALIQQSGKTLKLEICRPRFPWIPSTIFSNTSYWKIPPDNNSQHSAKSSGQSFRVSRHKLPKSGALGTSRYNRNEDSKLVRSRSLGHTENRHQDSIEKSVRRDAKKDLKPSHDGTKSVYIDPSYSEVDAANLIQYTSEDHRKGVRSHSSSKPPRTNHVRRITVSNVGSQLGIQIIGGNKVGIFVSSLIENSPAHISGLKVGDMLLTVNDIEFKNLTREESVIIILSLKNCPIIITVMNKMETFEKIRYQHGDEFFIRSNFDHLKPISPRELAFRKGDLFLIKDTLYGGTIGYWSASKIGVNEQQLESGVIPNKTRAEQLASNARIEDRRQREIRKRIRKNRTSHSSMNTRAEYQSQDRLDSISFNEESVQLPPYVKVAKAKASFKRPVVLLGSASDIFKDCFVMKLSSDFAYPVGKEFNGRYMSCNENPIKLDDIRTVVNSNKHCLLDISKEGIELLHHANLPPIVILIIMEDQKLASEFRAAAVAMVYGQGRDRMSKKEARNMSKYGLRFVKKSSNYVDTVYQVSSQTVDKVYMDLRDIIMKKQEDLLYLTDETYLTNAFDSVVIKGPNYESGFYSNSESGTEDEDFSTSRDDDDKVFRTERQQEESLTYDRGSEHLNKYYSKSVTIEDETEKDQTQDSQGYSRSSLKAKLHSSLGNSAETGYQQESVQSWDTKNVEMSLSSVLKLPVDSKGGMAESPYTKVSVFVPAGAFERSTSVEEVYFKVYLPKGTNNKNINYSGCPLVVCGPAGIKFARPLELRIPFCEQYHGNIESYVYISPNFNSHQETWSKMTLNKFGSSGSCYKLSENVTAVLIERF